MERTNTYQLELFSAQGESGALKPKNVNNPFLSYLRSYEKVILSIIGFVIVGIISFSLGVEKGKHIAIQRNNLSFDVALNSQVPVQKQVVVKQVIQQSPILKTQALNVQQVPVLKIPVVENKSTISAPSIKGSIGNYTIQVASYKSNSYAQKEANVLKKQGYVTMTLTKGNYIVLCVGNFNSKETAQSFVSQLKKRYQGCTIRRL